MFKFKKRFGQNFLLNEKIIDKITDCFHDFSDIIEVGPGNGALTKSLLNKGKSITAIDIDIDCINSLKDLNINLIHADILSYDLPNNQPIIGNLPYNISSKIVEKIVKKTVPFAVFMFQKEVAELLTGVDYNRLTIFAQSRYVIHKLMDVKPGNFFPVPKVNSQVVVFSLIDDYLDVNLDLLQKNLAIIFANRRKMIKHIGKKHPKLLEKIISIGIDPTLRAENVSKELYYDLIRSL